MNMDYVALTFIIVIAALWYSGRQWAKDPLNDRLRAIYEQFRKLRHDDLSESTLSYDGNTATVVHDHVEVILRRHEGHVQTLHRIFRNAHGEYFLFISGDPPFVEHLTRERAMNALRGEEMAFRREFGSGDT